MGIDEQALLENQAKQKYKECDSRVYGHIRIGKNVFYGNITESFESRCWDIVLFRCNPSIAWSASINTILTESST